MNKTWDSTNFLTFLIIRFILYWWSCSLYSATMHTSYVEKVHHFGVTTSIKSFCTTSDVSLKIVIVLNVWQLVDHTLLIFSKFSVHVLIFRVLGLIACPKCTLFFQECYNINLKNIFFFFFHVSNFILKIQCRVNGTLWKSNVCSVLHA